MNTFWEVDAAGSRYCLYVPVVDDVTVHYPAFNKRTFFCVLQYGPHVAALPKLENNQYRYQHVTCVPV